MLTSRYPPGAVVPFASPINQLLDTCALHFAHTGLRLSCHFVIWFCCKINISLSTPFHPQNANGHKKCLLRRRTHFLPAISAPVCGRICSAICICICICRLYFVSLATFVLGLTSLSRPQRLNNLGVKCVYAALSDCRDSQGRNRVNLPTPAVIMKLL